MKQHRASKIILAVIAWFFVFLGFLIAGLAVADSLADGTARVLPSYPKEDLSAVLAKAEWTEEDYDFLYHQTGVTRLAMEGLKGDDKRILALQEAFFYEGEIEHIMAAFTTPHDALSGDITLPIVPLEAGDVLVTSSCHTFGWRNGHSALVIDKYGTTLESVAPGQKSCLGEALWFQNATNFMVLRLKGVSAEERRKIAENAAEELLGVPYSLTVGIFSKKDQGAAPTATHCSHLVWQAFKNAGMDIDSDGGLIVTTNDIARSDLFEIVQINGFDPDKLW